MSTGDFQAALPVLLGEEAGGLSPTTITRLTASWEADYHAWRRRDLHDVDYVYVWVDGVHFRVRLGIWQNPIDRACFSEPPQ